MRRMIRSLAPLLALLLPGGLAHAQIKSQLLASGLAWPLFVAAPPGDNERIFIVGRLGTILIMKNDVILPTPFLDITSLVSSSANVELGLLGLAFDPDYDSNGFFYVHYTRNASPYESTIQRFTVSSNPDSADEKSITSILAVARPSAQHNGGDLLFGPDGYLYLGLGEGTVPANAQSLSTLLGKMIRIDPYTDDFPLSSIQNYGIPKSNPFAGSPGVLGEIWARGFRNPFRFSFDPETGDLYIGDVGGAMREEIDYQPSSSPGGENYGWPRMEGSLCFQPPTGCDDGSLTYPIHEYPHSPACSAVIGGVVYRGSALPSWLQGHYFFADFCQDPPNIWSFRVVGGTVTEFTDWTDALEPDVGPPIALVAAIGVDGLGEMYLVENRSTNGKVHRIVADPASEVSFPPAREPAGLHLSDGAPNPFTETTSFVLGVARASDARVLVHDAAGRLVRTLQSGRLAAGVHSLAWDGRDGGGTKLASGVYFVRASAEGSTITRRVTLFR